ncbi:hypothetical protein [Methanococcoides sp. NM1]|uniref:hypothetical protein n=1 Tax=Methanococcoides sp. NM1 TaxID=1201013 RepID=UPI0010846D36|nr:hypothetical protein [Methanococcoides sp. NM1]
MKSYLSRFITKDNKLLSFALALPVLIVLAVVSGFLLAFAIDRPDYAIRGLSTGLPAILASFILVMIYHKEDIELTSSSNTLEINQRTLMVLFGILLNVSILILLLIPFRPWYYFVLILMLYSLIFTQIFSRDANALMILSEIILLMFCVICGMILKYPLYFGWTDILPHLFMAKITYLSGHTIPLDYSLAYANFPLYHILIAESSYLLGLDLKTTLFLIATPIYVMLIVFIYKFFKLTTRNSQMSLLTCLIYSVTSVVILYGAYVITRTVAHAGFLIMIYLIYKGYSEKNEAVYRYLAVVLCIFIILVHQVSIIQMVILMLLLFVCERIAGNKKYLSTNFLLLVNVTFIGYWFYGAYLFTRSLLQSHIRPEHFETPVVKASVQSGNEWSFLVNHIDSSIFLFFALIGIGYVLWNENRKYARVFSLFALSTLVLYTPNPIQLLWQSMVLFRFDRFMLMLAPFMSFVMSAGIFAFLYYLMSKSIKIRSAFMIVLVLFSIFSFYSIISNANDSNYFGSTTNRKYFIEEELIGYNHVSGHVPFGSTLHSDYETSRYFTQREFRESDALELPYYRSYMISASEGIPDYEGYILIREKQFLDTKLVFEGEDYLPTSENQIQLYTYLHRNNKIYSNTAVDLYHNS